MNNNDNFMCAYPRKAAKPTFFVFFCCYIFVSGLVYAGQDNARINADGTIDFTVHYAYPPTAVDIDQLESTIRSASEIMCDATDNNLRFGEVTITAGSGGEAVADVWILPPGLWGRSSSSGFLLSDGARIFITQGGRTNTTFAHEMAHATLRLSDAYDEQSRGGRYYGIGFAVDPGRCSVTGDTCADTNDCGALETCVESDITANNHTLMGGKFGDPRCSISNNTCYSGDIDCTGGADRCETPDLYSEFSINGNHDTLLGDNSVCPLNRQSEQIVITGRLGGLAPVTTFQFNTVDEAETTSSGDAALRYIDSLGVVTGYEQNSSHNVLVYAEHRDAGNREWTLHFIMKGKHLMGEDEDDLILLGSIDIDFNGGATTYPATGAAAFAMRVCNGAICRVPGSAGYSNPTLNIPATSNGAPQTSLEVVFANGQQLVLLDATSGAVLSRSKILASDGGPPIGDCLASSAAMDSAFDDLCEAVVCEGMWNTSTKRWETSSAYSIGNLKGDFTYESEWDEIQDLPLVYAMGPDRPEEDAFNAAINAPAGLPSASPGACSGVGDQVIFDTQINGNDTLVLAIDTSNSMKQDYDSFGTTKTRLEWAQSAARALADLVEMNNLNFPDAQSLGMVKFSGTVKEVFQPQALGLPGNSTAQDFQLVVDGLSAGGNTGLPGALFQAGVTALNYPSTLNPAIVALTDGEANVCLNGEKCGVELATDEAIKVVDELSAAGVDVYFTPIGGQLGTGVFGEAVTGAGGEIYYSESARDIPIQFAQAYLRHSGRSAALDATAWTLIPTNPTLSTKELFVPVEEGASSLTILLSSRNDDVDNWNIGFRIASPSGLHYSPGSPEITLINDQGGNFYRIVRISMVAGNLEAGKWRINIFPSGGGVQSGYTMAWTDTPEPDCYAGLSAPVFRSTDKGVIISAQASWHTPIDRASYSAIVKRPDGSEITVAMKIPSLDTPMAEGVFDKFAGRGLYQVKVSCAVNDAQFWYGEDLHSDAQPEPVNAPDFYRQTATAFFLDVDSYPPLPRGKDCDGDGIPNDDEGVICLNSRSQICYPDPKSLDSDKDGVIDACDSDSDNDDMLDGDERTGDADKDGVPNRHDPDSDNDGILDGGDRRPYSVKVVLNRKSGAM